MNFLRCSAGVFAATLIFTTAPSMAALSDPRVAQLVAASSEALGVSSLASVRTIRFDADVTAVGLKGTLTQYVDVRDGRFAETTTLEPVVSADGYDGRV